MEDKQHMHEWRRFFARFIDISLLSMPIHMLLRILPPTLYSENAVIIFIVSAFLWVFVESFLLSVWGTTPGKFLYKISLQGQDGEGISFSRALKRSFTVWFKGLGCGFPLITVVTMLVAGWKLSKRGTTSWDESGRFFVTHSTIGFTRWVVILFTLLLIILFPASDLKMAYELLVM